MQQIQLPVRNAGLYSAVRNFVTAAFEQFRLERQAGADVSFSVEEHRRTRDDRPFYEYRPMIERFVRERVAQLAETAAYDDAAWTVASDPACSAWLRAGRVDSVTSLEDVARDEVLIPLLVTMAELNPAFELDEDHLLAQYLRLERAIYSEHRRYVAMVPIWGVRLLYGDLELAPGVTIRGVDEQMFRMEWPEAAQLNWGDTAGGALPQTVLQFERAIAPTDDDTVLDPLPAVTNVVAVLRALAGGSVHAGPVVLERLDYGTLAPRPVPSIAARRCGTLPTKIDATVARSLPTALRRLAADPDGAAARGLERWQIAATAPGMSALRAVFDALVEIYAEDREVGAAALRVAIVLGSSLPERQVFRDAMLDAARMIRSGGVPDETTPATTRTLAAALRATVAAALVGDLPITSLRAYADGILMGEHERRPLGVAALHPGSTT